MMAVGAGRAAVLGMPAREPDSCSVYGTGRIHCEQSRSVNYRRAINRAETDPRVGLDGGDPRGALTSGAGAGGDRRARAISSAWPTLALAHFCSCLSALSNHVQCQYGTSRTLQLPSAPPTWPSCCWVHGWASE